MPKSSKHKKERAADFKVSKPFISSYRNATGSVEARPESIMQESESDCTQSGSTGARNEAMRATDEKK
jgi:hypothetical protein